MLVCLFAMNERHAVGKAGLSERKSCHKQMHKKLVRREEIRCLETTCPDYFYSHVSLVTVIGGFNL